MHLVTFVSCAPPGRSGSSQPELHLGVVHDGSSGRSGDSAVGLPSETPSSWSSSRRPSERAALSVTDSGPSLPAGGGVSPGARSPPPKVMGIGMNYRAHVAEMGVDPPPEHQVWFNKQRTCVIGPGAAIEIPAVSAQVDYEGELAFVIGRRCRHVPRPAPPSVVAGFTVMNDVRVRDWQWRTPTWTWESPSTPTGPPGPWLVTPTRSATRTACACGRG